MFDRSDLKRIIDHSALFIFFSLLRDEDMEKNIKGKPNGERLVYGLCNYVNIACNCSTVILCGMCITLYPSHNKLLRW